MKILYILFFLSQTIYSKEMLVSFGEHIFSDKNISADKKVSCSTCHKKELLFTDGYEFAFARGFKQPRNTPSLLTLRAYSNYFWDSTVSSMLEAIKAPLLDGVEIRSHEKNLSDYLKENVLVKKNFNKYNFDSYTILVTESIKSYLLSEQTTSTKYWSNSKNLSRSEINGKDIFNRKGKCIKCHKGKYMTDGKLHHSSLFKRKTILNFDGLSFSLNTDYGHGRLNQGKDNIYKFRTPSLINVALTAPYMHDGSFNNLDQVIDYYNRRGDDSKFPLPKISLTEKEKKDLISFLETLTDERYANGKF